MSFGERMMRLLFAAIGIAVAVGIYRLSAWFVALCGDVEVIGHLLVRRLLDIVLLVLMSVLLLSNLVSALGTFFLAGELGLLVTAPIPLRTLFAARFAQQLTQSSWMVLAFGLPVLLGFVRAAGTAHTWVALLLIVPPLLVIPAALAAIVTVSLVSVLPASRARNLVVGLLFIGFVVLYVALRLIEPERLLNPDGFASMVGFLASFSSASTSALPSHWASAVLGRSFDHAVAGLGAPLHPALLWSGAAATYAAASLLFRATFAHAFSLSQQVPAHRGASGLKKRAERSFVLARILAAILPGRINREFLVKDLKLTLRDAGQWSQLILLVALVFVYLYNFRYFRSISDSGLVGRLPLLLIGQGLAGFVTAAISVRFAFPAISLEGKMIEFLRVAPLRMRQVLVAKALSTMPPLVLLATLMAVVSARILQVSGSLVALAACVSLATAIAMSTLCTGLGAVFADYKAGNGAKVATSFGGLICMSLCVAVALVMVACAIHPAYALYHNLPLDPRRTLTGLLAGLALLVVSTYLPLRLGVRALSGDGQEN